MAKITQTYHHVVLHSALMHYEYIINAPLDVEEMYMFVKKRLANISVNSEIRFHDTITDNPGCPDVISLNTFANKLINMDCCKITSLTKVL
jgi:hypothetical protein